MLKASPRQRSHAVANLGTTRARSLALAPGPPETARRKGHTWNGRIKRFRTFCSNKKVALAVPPW
eukprot:4687747-Alexandrium_andersonii.AAC.1